MIFKKLTAFCCTLLLTGAACAQTSILDWNTVDWTATGAAGSTISQTFTNVDSSGIDITISLTLTGDRERHKKKGKDRYDAYSDWIDGGPDDNNTFGGDGATQGGESLYLGINLASDDITQSYLDVTIEFSQAVNSASFSLYDVDRYGYNYWGGYETGIQFEDVIEQIEGSYMSTTVAGSVTHNTSYINQITNTSGTAYIGNTDLYNVYDQDDNPASTLNLAWSSPVDTISFRYGTGPGAVADPGNQAIGMSGISFYQYQAVPEPGTYLLGALGSLTLFFSFIRRRNRMKIFCAEVSD